MKKVLSICNCNLGCQMFDAKKTGENIRRVREYINKTYFLSRKVMVDMLWQKDWEIDEASLGNWERGDRNISLENLCRLVKFFSLVCGDDPEAPPHTLDGLVVFSSDREIGDGHDDPSLFMLKTRCLQLHASGFCIYGKMCRMYTAG